MPSRLKWCPDTVGESHAPHGVVALSAATCTDVGQSRRVSQESCPGVPALTDVPYHVPISSRVNEEHGVFVRAWDARVAWWIVLVDRAPRPRQFLGAVHVATDAAEQPRTILEQQWCRVCARLGGAGEPARDWRPRTVDCGRRVHGAATARTQDRRMLIFATTGVLADGRRLDGKPQSNVEQNELLRCRGRVAVDHELGLVRPRGQSDASLRVRTRRIRRGRDDDL